jgi:hypothetical protein
LGCFYENIQQYFGAGAKRSASSNAFDAEVDDGTDLIEKKLHIIVTDKPTALFDPVPFLSRFVSLFFIFFFLQVVACLFVFEEEADNLLFQFSISSFAFSATTIFMEL